MRKCALVEDWKMREVRVYETVNDLRKDVGKGKMVRINTWLLYNNYNCYFVFY